MLTQEQVKNLFEYNPVTGILRWKVSPSNNVTIGDVAGTLHQDGGIHISINNKIYKAHRIAWLYEYGQLPDLIDHKDRIRHHNWISNLRDLSKSENAFNVKLSTKNTSGFKGVYFDKQLKKWRSQIFFNGNAKYLGSYQDINDAICVRFAAEQCLGLVG